VYKGSGSSHSLPLLCAPRCSSSSLANACSNTLLSSSAALRSFRAFSSDRAWRCCKSSAAALNPWPFSGLNGGGSNGTVRFAGSNLGHSRPAKSALNLEFSCSVVATAPSSKIEGFAFGLSGLCSPGERERGFKASGIRSGGGGISLLHVDMAGGVCFCFLIRAAQEPDGAAACCGVAVGVPHPKEGLGCCCTALTCH
jgi:hypothetical protein